jgi:hypothetical protein
MCCAVTDGDFKSRSHAESVDPTKEDADRVADEKTGVQSSEVRRCRACLPSVRAGQETPRSGEETGSAAGVEAGSSSARSAWVVVVGWGWWRSNGGGGGGICVGESRGMDAPPFPYCLPWHLFGRGLRAAGQAPTGAPPVSYHSLHQPQAHRKMPCPTTCSHPCARWAHRDRITSCHVDVGAPQVKVRKDADKLMMHG